MNALIRSLAWSIAVALVVLPLVAVLNGWLAADRFPIQRLSVSAEFSRVSAEQLRTAVAVPLQAGFFALDTSAVQQALLGLPWVSEVEVRKRWPDVVELRILEHHAVARWGKQHLLSEAGALFAAPGAADIQGLIQLDGPTGRETDVLAFAAKARQQLTPSALHLHGVRLSARGSWSLTLADGSRVLLGRSDMDARLQRLARHLPGLLASEPAQLERADLRYGNGFALRWQTMDEAQDSTTPANAPTTPAAPPRTDA